MAVSSYTPIPSLQEIGESCKAPRKAVLQQGQPGAQFFSSGKHRVADCGCQDMPKVMEWTHLARATVSSVHIEMRPLSPEASRKGQGGWESGKWEVLTRMGIRAPVHSLQEMGRDLEGVCEWETDGPVRWDRERTGLQRHRRCLNPLPPPSLDSLISASHSRPQASLPALPI